MTYQLPQSALAKLPVLGLELPERVRFRSELDKLESNLLASTFLGFYSTLVSFKPPGGQMNGAGRNEAMNAFATDVTQLRTGLLRYVDAEVPVPAAQAFFGLQAPVSMLERGRDLWTKEYKSLAALHFSDFAPRRLIGVGISDVDRFEAAMAPVVSGLSPTLAEATGAEAWRVYATWHRLVRLSVAACMTAAIPYDPVFADLYGNAGWWLAGEVSGLAADIRRSRAFQQLEVSAVRHRWMEPYVTFTGVGGGASRLALPLGANLKEAEQKAKDWRANWGPVPRTGKRRRAFFPEGELFPFEFAPIPHDLFGDDALEKLASRSAGTTQAEWDELTSGVHHLYARPVASFRMRCLTDIWNGLCQQVLGIEDEATGRWTHLRMTAGTLKYGGAHPPHVTHRNGAMFDLVIGDRGKFEPPRPEIKVAPPGKDPWDDLGAMCKLTTRPGPMLQDLIAAMRRLLFDLHDEPAEQEQEPHGPWKFTGPGVKGTKRTMTQEELAILFTQAILLTFPSQILFAPWKVLQRAWSDLLVQAEARISDRDAAGLDKTDAEGTALAFIVARLTPPPPVSRPQDGRWGGPPRRKASEKTPALTPTRVPTLVVSKADHANHWHVSYLPAELDQADDERDVALRWARKNAPILWPAGEVGP